MKGLLNKLEAIFEMLKLLDIKPTPQNVSILNAVYEDLRGIYKELGEMENAGSKSE